MNRKVFLVFLILGVLFTGNCRKTSRESLPSLSGPILEGGVQPNLRNKDQELAFIQKKAKAVHKNAAGYWEAEFIHDIVMIYIPGNTFIMGNDKLHKDVSGSPAAPQHPVTLTGYWIAKKPVTKAQFRIFVTEENYVTSVEKQGHEGPWVYDFKEKGFITVPGFHWDNAFFRSRKSFPMSK